MNKTLNYTLYMTIVSVAIVGTFACSDFLNEPPKASLDESVLANENGVEGNLLSAYALLDGFDSGTTPGWAGASSNWVLGSITSDNAHKGSESGDQQGLDDIEVLEWQLGNADQQLNDKWEVLYNGVDRTNSTLRQLEKSADDISESQRNRIRGEALALRAYYHFEVYKVWKNVPYVTEDVESFDLPNTEPVLPKILADFDQSIDLLPPTQEDVGRVTIWTAKALKSRALMFGQQFNDALSLLRDVVNNGPYQLERNFWQVFSAFNDNGSETVFAYQATVNDGAPGGENGNFNDRLNFPFTGSPLPCCGFHQPTQNLVNAFQVDENGLPLPVTQPNDWNIPDDNPDPNVSVDPRLDWTVGRPGVPFVDWAIHSRGWSRSPVFGGIYHAKKNIYEESSNASSNVGWSSFQLHSKNTHLLRYADVLLMLAEAEVEVGSLENARDIVNQIRVRASQAAQGPLDDFETSLDDPRITWANYQIGTYEEPWTDKEFARRAVRTERRLELAMEGHRLFDLRRWDMDQEVINNYLEVEQTRRQFLKGSSGLQERHDRYPIPSEQIDLTTELQQNPGW